MVGETTGICRNNHMGKIEKELQRIGRLLESYGLVDAIRKEVRRAAKHGENTRIVDGSHTDHPNYDVVIEHNGDKRFDKVLKRRIRKALKDVEIKEFDSVVDRLTLGIRKKNQSK